MRQMTANLHVSEECKKELDKIIPKKINNEKVSYDDGIRAMIQLIKNELNYTDRDIMEMLIMYKTQKLQVVTA